MSVVGIDFGYNTCYISVARAGGIETIANDYSMRDSPSFVGFGDRQRVMGVSAKNQLLTNLKRTFFGFKSLLGRTFSDPVVQTEVKSLPFPVTQGPNDSILVNVNYLGSQQSYTPEQLTAMLFTKLRETAETALQNKVKDVVVSVPIYYTDCERRALLDAATIAGLNVLKLMNDTTATALAYGIYKQDLPPPEEKARNVVFVDCGHRGIQVATSSFNKGKLVMQSCAYDFDCSGRAFNQALADYFAEDFKKRYKVDANTSPKAMLKLLSEVEKIKKQMSANTNKIPLNIECFMEDKDVSGGIDRATFEELITPQLNRIEEVLKEALAASKWKPEDIYSVEIVGGSTRVPAIKTLIEKIFGKAPNTTLNADEAVSRGCALQCAILSPTFKVREFSVTDIQPFAINLKWHAESDKGDMEVFPKFHAVPFSKMLTFYRRDTFALEGEYGETVPLPNPHIGKFEIGEVKPMEDGSNQKVKVKIRVNLNGIFTVASASRSEKHEIEEEVPMEVETKDDKKDGEKKEGEESKADGDKTNTTDEAMDTQEAQPAPEAAPPAVDPAPAAEPPKTQKRKKTVTKTIDLPVTGRSPGSLLRDKLESHVDLEKSLTSQDKQEADRLTSRNAVEEYIYDIRSKIFDELENFISEDDRSKFSLELEDAENWLYEDGEDCEKNVYVEKLKELKLKGEPVKKRKTEFEARPMAIEALGHTLQLASKALDMYTKGDEKYAHMDKVDMEKVAKLIEEKRSWMDENCATLSSLDKTTNPTVLAVQFYTEKQAFDAIVNPILNKPKPKPPKEEKKEDKKEDSKDKEGKEKAANNDDASKTTGEQAVNGSNDSQMDLD